MLSLPFKKKKLDGIRILNLFTFTFVVTFIQTDNKKKDLQQ